MCDHLHEQTSHYDARAKLLSFLLVCPACGTEQVVQRLPYEPRYKPCLLPSRERSSFLDRAAATERLPLAA
jgi:hypothetical protein